MPMIFILATEHIEEKETSRQLKIRLPFRISNFPLVKINYYRYKYLYLTTYYFYTNYRTLINI